MTCDPISTIGEAGNTRSEVRFKILAGPSQTERRVVLCWDGAQLLRSDLAWSNKRISPRRLRYSSFEEALRDDPQLRELQSEFGAILVDPPLGKSQFYARIARNIPEDELPFLSRDLRAANFYIEAFPKEWLSVNVAASHLFAELEQIFRVVEPVHGNARVYGHRLRHALVLACTEVEACWKGVLRANGYSKERLSTSDYIKLKAPMGLDIWGVTLASYPEFGEQRPFANWSPENPTQSLGWYSAYNAVKHDREGSLEQATLEHVISAYAALTVMVYAQFGRGATLYAIPKTTIFQASTAVQWEPRELYFGEGPWTPMPYDFSS